MMINSARLQAGAAAKPFTHTAARSALKSFAVAAMMEAAA